MDNSSPQPLAVAYSSAQLPRLPIPNLGDTVNKYLDTVRPLVSEREFEETRRKALAFAAAGGPGEVLQARLKARAEKAAAEPAHSPSSCWLTQWWNDYAYFENRESICFNVNYFFGFQKHPQGHPQTQADVAAILVHKALQVRQVVESGRYPQVTMRGKPLCMTQFQYMFGTCRHPGDGKDQTEKYDEPLSRHIAIAHRGRFYVLNAFDKDGQLLDLETIKCYINLVLKGGYSGSDMPSIGVLTTTPRQQWYHAREALIRVSSTNAKNLRRLESAAFLLSLEDSEPQTRHEMSRACWHGNGQNRYFDKNLQLLVFANGRYGFNGEHSMTDATTDLELCNRLVEAVESATAPIAAPAHVPGNPSEALTLLEFDYNSDLLTAIKRANDYFSVTVASHEYFAGKCDSFGKEAIKKLNVSPDAFIQMAFQIGFYRLFGRTVATYESTSTRGFHRGRTETSRSISDASKLLCQRMVEVDRHGVSNLQHQGELEDLFRKAVAAQSAYTAACARGQGIDRHLLGLRLSLKADDETPELFLDTAFKKSQHWVLSTSQISDPTLDVYGWGEVVPEGFGVAYSINDHSIHFGISSRNRGSRALADAIHQALLDSYEILRGKWKPNACEPATYSESLDSVDTVVEKLSDIKCTATDAEPNPATSDGAKRPVLTPRVSSSSFVHSIESRLVRTLRRSFHWVSASAGVKSSTSLGGGSGSGASN